ncbi:hypothetical protein DPEC_G00169220 [Dallia pectoralis]|uniref:Uncharacterized protein n=1 Tax=Dallia pectoralis TaxID=75939 RepID=A0ACC2GCZ3_DALPE|nr:hypothetical protein DPEC_G00169220 [Dallia pectoralis]
MEQDSAALSKHGNCSEGPRFNIVVKEEPEDLDVNNTGESPNSSSSQECFSSSSYRNQHQKTHTGQNKTAEQGSQQPVSVEESGLSLLLDIKVKKEEEDPASDRADNCPDSKKSPCTLGEPGHQLENLTAKSPYSCSVVDSYCKEGNPGVSSQSPGPKQKRENAQYYIEQSMQEIFTFTSGSSYR